MNKKPLVIIGVIVLVAATFFLTHRNPSGHKAVKARKAHKAAADYSVKINDKATLLSNAQKLLAQGDTNGGIKTLEVLVSKYQVSEEAETAYFILGGLYEKIGNILKAKEAYQKIIERFPNSKRIAKAQEASENMNIKILFSPVITLDTIRYEVRKGDTLIKIAKKFNTTVDIISRANELKTTTIKVGDKLRVSKGKFSIVVDKSQNILTLKSGEEIVKTYRVATGKSSSTPVGVFKITNKVINPPWYPTSGGVVPAGSPKNILGSRWLGISKPGYGIHGTTQPESIGKSVTEGCIRMKNSDVEELYSIVLEGTQVTIVN